MPEYQNTNYQQQYYQNQAPVQQYPQNPPAPQPAYPPQQLQQNDQPPLGPRDVSLFTLILKTFWGIIGGGISSIIFVLTFVLASSVLSPITGAEDAEFSIMFIAVIMLLIFVACLISSMLTPYLLATTERERYTRITSALYQIFFFNLLIFGIVAPIYLTSSATSLEFTGYAAGMQIILVATASALITEIINDPRYPIMGVYTTIVAILIASTLNLIIFKITNSTNITLFTVLPIIWGSIGFFQGAFAMIYRWYFDTYGLDYLASDSTYGVDYGTQAQEDFEYQQQEEQENTDVDGSDFLKN